MSIYDQEQPKNESGLFLRLNDGDTVRLRMIGDGIVFKKKYDGDTEPKVSFASVVLAKNEAGKREVKVYEFGWSVQKQLRTLRDDEDWGNLECYDVAITRTGEKLDTKYTVVPKKPAPLTEDDRELLDDASIDLKKVCRVGVQDDEGGEYDPFPNE